MNKQEIPSPEIEVLNLGVKSFNALKRAGVNTIADIENHMEQLKNTIAPTLWKEILNAANTYKGIPIPGSLVEKDMLGDELTFDEITNMVGELIVMDLSTESHEWYKVEKVEEIINGTDGKRHLRTYGGSKQRGSINEIFFDKNQHKPQRAWKLKNNSPAELPAPIQRELSVASDFDYSTLDTDTANSLRQCETVIRTETAGYFTLLGAKFKEAQELLANHSTGTFEQWYTAMGFKRQTVYNLIQRFEFSSSPKIEGREDAFEALPLTLSYEISKPTAPAELVDKVLDGDITSNAEYQKLKAELERTKDDLRNVEMNFDEREKLRQKLGDENVKLRIKIQEQDKALNSISDKDEEIHSLRQQIKKLESRPIDVAVQTDEAALAEKDEEIAELKEQLERLSDKGVKTFAIRMTIDEYERLANIVEKIDDINVKVAVKNARMIRI